MIMNPFDIHKDHYAKAAYWRPDEETLSRMFVPGKILLCGVGGGRTIAPLKAKGFEVTALDNAPGLVAECKKNHPDDVVLEADMQKLPFADESFDTVFAPFHAIAYATDLDLAVSELVRVTKKGGMTVINLPNRLATSAIQSGIVRYPTFEQSVAKGGVRVTAHHVFPWHFKGWDWYGRISLCKLEHPNWKDRVLTVLPWLDRSLYFVKVR